ncbi:c-type cytochrome biogenesis protein CcmI [Rhodoblastus sp.]|uniref:c-type cytochrome biogenesis protein CcmI n=1 Tax=Rhodoblastus sp. TaxID=1962975 RepID=UPI0035B3643C
MIWLVFALLTGAAVLSILWPLSRPAPKPREDPADVAFYRAQIAEIDAEFARGGLAKDQAEAAKAQAGRRLLAAASGEVASADSPKARRIAAALALVAAPAIALGLYARIGRPELPDMPLQARMTAAPGEQDFSAVIAKMEAHIAAHPDDGRALELMAPVYLRMGRYDDAVNAYRKAIVLLGETPERLLRYAQALSYANDGTTPPEAVAQLERALQLDPKNAGARFYLGLAAAQQGDKAKARALWTALLDELPPDSRGRREIIEKLAMLDAPAEQGPAPAPGEGAAPSKDAAAAVAAQPVDEQQKMIRGMVDRLAQRIAAQGGSGDEWLRLIRAYKVLNEPDKAQTALDEAHKALSGDAASQQKLAALAQELGLRETGQKIQ